MSALSEKQLEKKRAYKRLWAAKNSARIAEYNRDYYLKDLEASRERAREWRVANPEKRLEYKRLRYATNKEVVLAENRQWRVDNPAKMHKYETAKKIARRVRSKLPIPPAEQAEIDGMYQFCQIFPMFEVDHILPIKGKKVSGLHVLANLQVLPRRENRVKSNKFDTEQAA